MESDFVIVTVPGSVKHLVSYRELELMKPTAVLVSVSANPIDYDALYEGLLYKNIGGAVLDTWPQGCWHFPETRCGPPLAPDVQPYANSKLRELDSAAWVGVNLISLVAGRPLQGVVRNGTAAYASEAFQGGSDESAVEIAV